MFRIGCPSPRDYCSADDYAEAVNAYWRAFGHDQEERGLDDGCSDEDEKDC